MHIAITTFQARTKCPCSQICSTNNPLTQKPPQISLDMSDFVCCAYNAHKLGMPIAETCICRQ